MKMALSEDDCNFLMYGLEFYNPEAAGELKRVNDLHRRVLNLRSLIWNETEKPTEALVELKKKPFETDLAPIVDMRYFISCNERFPYHTTSKLQVRRQGSRVWEDVLQTTGEI